MLKKLFYVFLISLLPVIGVIAYGWHVMEQQMQATLPLAQERTVQVRSGTSFNQLTRLLQQEGLVGNVDLVRLYARLNPQITAIKAGEYRLQPDESLLQLLDRMNRGDVVRHYFTLIEGHTFDDMRLALSLDDRITQTLDDINDDALMEMLGSPDLAPEGMFLAETYQFQRDDTDVDMLRRAHRDLQTFLEQQWESRDESLPYESPYEALIMASIIEKETGVPEERAKIAGVFVRRLEVGMRLQTDPTVIYGMGDSYEGRIRRADLQQPTPYNTYTISGLPPTPISLVGREAIVAALNPERGDWLYFVAKGDGSHQFSRTLQEHNAAVRQYQLNRRSDYRSSPGG
ncbi:endolytic transglycosylase MltG [Nitrincola sp. MINF-07-Sa-05]|uniref:endolytic transglycosylase MltG n=1 Tax=Nitrincola salilacus TaxID=3400273 RepID=UPI00391830C1